MARFRDRRYPFDIGAPRNFSKLSRTGFLEVHERKMEGKKEKDYRAGIRRVVADVLVVVIFVGHESWWIDLSARRWLVLIRVT